ncbi:MAG: four helix bundle protein [Cyclobacteriaceae bacterium]|nr:four helix bundle protein [Cyclobacteriaceae bacterium]
MRNDRENIIVNLTTTFALKIIAYSEYLEQKGKLVVARQLLRSGTAIGAMVREAQNAESKADFIHKFKIAAKEADETSYWLVLCKEANTYPDPDQSLIAGLEDVSKIITKIIATSKVNKA